MRQIPPILSKSLPCFLLFLIFLAPGFYKITHAQNFDFPFGEISSFDLKSAVYDKDTSAVALVLNETGDAWMDTDNGYELVVNYHVRIKIFKQAGVEKANVVLPLRKSDKNKERIIDLQASSFNLVDGVMLETKMNNKAIFEEDGGKFYDYKKFTIANAKAGSIIEYKFSLRSPYIYNFYTWEFQSDIPKRKSEYWATIPGNYIYNLSLRGSLKLSLNENKIIQKCVVISGGSYGTGIHADCIRYKFAMEEIPAFVEEEYMTAKLNFLSAIYFELSEVRYFDGRVDKVTKQWKDADEELKMDKKFGVQLKRGKDVIGEQLKTIAALKLDSLGVANKVYDYVKESYQWNEVYGIYSEFGVKEALVTKRGNVGDINLTLIAALKYAGFTAEPLILSTRRNGLPTDIYPVISDFNYVIAKVKIGGKVYLLDATDDFMPFGMLPERCFNGKGRVLAEKGSYWHEIKPTEKARIVNMCNMKIAEDGKITGIMQRSFFGYRAVSKRKELLRFSDTAEYENALSDEFGSFKPSDIKIEHVNELNKPVAESFAIEADEFVSAQPANFLFNPFLTGKLEKNPFKSETRLYPVDFGVPIDEMYILKIELPENISVSTLPEKVALGLPEAGGRFICDFKQEGSTLTLTNMFSISRTVYSAEEYHYLRELFNRMIQTQQIDLVFTKK
ncbi:MAG: DUF3857 domain-containing protein [Cytophagia bacterium]|nr:DUF3857 domain-containing protein [Cytophagia bacterium]